VNEYQHKQIMLFDALSKSGNTLVGLDEMNAHAIVKKLWIVEKTAKTVWEALEAHYGYGFFNKLIEEEFGIEPDFQEKIKDQFLSELHEVKHDASEKIAQVTSTVQGEIQKLQMELKEKNALMSYRRQAQI